MHDLCWIQNINTETKADIAHDTLTRFNLVQVRRTDYHFPKFTFSVILVEPISDQKMNKD